MQCSFFHVVDCPSTVILNRIFLCWFAVQLRSFIRIPILTGWEVQKQRWDGFWCAGYLLGIVIYGRRIREQDWADEKSIYEAGQGKTQQPYRELWIYQALKIVPWWAEKLWLLCPLHNQSLDVSCSGKGVLGDGGSSEEENPEETDTGSGPHTALAAAWTSPFLKKADLMEHLQSTTLFCSICILLYLCRQNYI